jgi:hypothetical protein
MARALRKSRRPDGNRPEPVKVGAALDAEALPDTGVHEILDSDHESPRTLDAAMGIRNGLIGGVIFWAVVAAAYFVLR